MPRPKKDPYLYERRRPGRAACWVIRDGQTEIATGCALEQGEDAKAALARYCAEKYLSPSSPQKAAALSVSAALNAYISDKLDGSGSPETMLTCVEHLNDFFGDMSVADIKGPVCRRYVRTRGVANGTARRELGVLGTALNYCRVEGLLIEAPPVWLPPPSRPRERWLTRPEAARFLWAARRTPHMTIFALLALYTGSRSSVLKRLQWASNEDGGHVDFAEGIIYRKAAATPETKKRAPAIRMGPELARYLRWWRQKTRTHVVEWRGQPVRSIKTAFNRTKARAYEAELEAAARSGRPPLYDLRDAVPHDLRRTAITWAMQNGAEKADACDFFGITMAEMERTYWKHSPKAQGSVIHALGRGRRREALEAGAEAGARRT